MCGGAPVSLRHVHVFFPRFCPSPVYPWFLSLQLFLMKRLRFSCRMHLCSPPPQTEFLFVLGPHDLASSCLPCWLSEVQLELSPLASPFPRRLLSPSDLHGALCACASSCGEGNRMQPGGAC